MVEKCILEWLGSIPSHWDIQKGKFVFKQRNSKGNSKNLELLSPTQKYGVIPQMKYEELTGMGAVKLNDKIDLNGLKTICKGDYCISLRSFQGGFEYSQYEGVVSPAYQVFYATIPINEGYYRYLFKDKCFIDKMNSYTMSLRDGKNISFTDFGNTYLPVPPLDEQNRIAEFLDDRCTEIDAISSEIQEQINTLEEYKKSVITDAVTKGLNPNVEMKDSGIEWIGQVPKDWTSTRLGVSSWVRARLGWKGLRAEEYVDEGHPFLSAFNIVNNKVSWESLNYINDERYDESPEIKLSIGDIIIVKDGAGIGKCARINSLPLGTATTNSSLGVITTRNRLSNLYLYYYLQCAVFQNLIFRMINGMGVPHLTQETLRKIVIPLPTLEEQRQITEYLDSKCAEIDGAIEDKQKQFETLEDYKKTLIYEYVTGKKVVA